MATQPVSTALTLPGSICQSSGSLPPCMENLMSMGSSVLTGLSGGPSVEITPLNPDFWCLILQPGWSRLRRTGTPEFPVGFGEGYMKHVWTLLLVFICHKYKPLCSASSPPPSPSLLVHNTHLHPCQMPIFSSPLSLTSLPNFPSCAAEHFYCLPFLLGVGSLLPAEYHSGNMIPANNY